MPSIDQLSHGACVLVATRKWSCEAGLLTTINTWFKHVALLPVTNLNSTKVRIVVAMVSHDFVSSCDSHDENKKFLNRMHGKEDKLKPDKETINSHDLSNFCEWTTILASKHEVGNNT